MRKIFFVLSIAFITLSQFGFAEEGSTETPIIGSSCSSLTEYRMGTETNQPWTLKSLVAVPDSYVPTDWANTNAFLNSVETLRATVNPPASLVSAVLDVWQQSYNQPAHLYASFVRSVAIEAQVVNCVSGIWQVSEGNQEIEQRTDDSGWVQLSDQLLSNNDLTDQGLQQLVEDKLARFNSQPGADTTPANFIRTITE